VRSDERNFRGNNSNAACRLLVGNLISDELSISRWTNNQIIDALRFRGTFGNEGLARETSVWGIAANTSMAVH
jgi:hypothetical protein